MRSVWSLGVVLIAAIGVAGRAGASSTADSGASLRVEPAIVGAAAGSTFSVRIVQDLPVATSGAQASLDFDPGLLQVESIARGAAYEAAPIVVPLDLADSIRTANDTGHLAQVAAAFTPPTAVAAGPTTFLTIRFRVAGCGLSALALPADGPFGAQAISGEAEGYGQPVPVTTGDGRVTTCVAPGAVTGDAVGLPADAATSAGATKGALIAAGLGAGALVISVIGGLAWRSRRASGTRAMSRGGSMRRS